MDTKQEFDDEISLYGVTEYREGHEVKLCKSKDSNNRWAIQALNEGECNSTLVDLFELIEWLMENRPDIEIKLNDVSGGDKSGYEARV